MPVIFIADDNPEYRNKRYKGKDKAFQMFNNRINVPFEPRPVKASEIMPLIFSC